MNCWAILGLMADADSRSIKRQYATLLKVHRPDEDPSGFQRLREAYEQAMEWSRRKPVVQPFGEREQTVEVQPPPASLGAEFSFELKNVQFGERPRQQQAAQLLENVTVDQLDQRLAQARVSHCTIEFENQLLMMCLKPREDAMLLAAWGLQQFNWLSAWQRADLSPKALELLCRAYCHEVKKQLGELLDSGQFDAFIERFLALKQADWLQPFERHDWFNETLASLLVDSRFWSAQVFETLRSHQHWHPTGGRCPEPYWSALLERRDNQATFEAWERLAVLNDREPHSRAARLLLTPMTTAERSAFARRFFEADWNACRTLSEKIQRLHPQRCCEMPNGDPYFWKALMQPRQTWPMYAGLLGASLTWAAGEYLNDKSGIGASFAAMLFWLCVLATPGAALLWVWRPLADRFWSQDVRLSRAVSPRLSFRRPAPLILRELLPCWLMGALTWVCCGATGLAAYTVVVLALSALSRVVWPETLRIKRPKVRLPALGSAPTIALMVGVIGLTILFYTIASSQLMGPDQGLQQFAKRGCSGPLDSRQECRVAPTHKQWYGQSHIQGARL
ncbi:J domain-containing protein [Pseudomonas sp. H3(2019)]|uniref:J domain-containing protein n=1 Tax=Pseudomonas sp. H3(2019) TaxID=2598724 RepID=UPI001195AC62|nr:J domain-containing protein [Pseudomonas sp. H3(2019)]TVT83058.1 J domain-containing protein [Pseudomonas sp. H3(2019)]